MPSYRFCRPDDIPFLVEAVNLCVEMPGQRGPLTVADFQREVRELDVWPSNCMTAKQGEHPIAVLIATKRTSEVLIHRVGVRPEHRRQGHGKHLLTSLRQKLAVLGPDRIVAEVPSQRSDLRDFFAAGGFACEASLQDYVLREPLQGLSAANALTPVTLDELERHGALDGAVPMAWERQSETLLKRADSLKALAVATDRLEAFLLYRDTPQGRIIERLEGEESPQRGLFFGLLLRQCSGRDCLPVRMPKVGPDEPCRASLIRMGFAPEESCLRFAAASLSV